MELAEEPRRPLGTQVTIRLDGETSEQLRAVAAAERMGHTTLVRRLVIEALARRREVVVRETLDSGAEVAVVPGSGRAVEPRRLDQMASVRLDPELAASLRALASKRGTTVSEQLRRAAEHWISDGEAAEFYADPANRPLEGDPVQIPRRRNDAGQVVRPPLTTITRACSHMSGSGPNLLLTCGECGEVPIVARSA